MADRWVKTPHTYPYTCHRCHTSDPAKGPYLYLDWNYTDAGNGTDCRFFMCNSCYQYIGRLDGAPVADVSPQVKQLEKVLAAANAEIQRLKETPPVFKVVSIDEVKTEIKPKPAPRKKPAAKKKPTTKEAA